MERARCTGPLPEPVRKVLATHMRAVLKPGTKLPAAEVPPDPAKTTRQG